MIKKNLKKLLILFISSIPLYCVCFWIGNWQEEFKFPYDNEYQKDPTTELHNQVDIDKEYGEKSILSKLLEVFWFNRDVFYWDHKFIYYVRAILNMALWLLSFIALITVIYTFYMMFFTENEAWIKKAKWNLVGIFIALAVIWLAWLIVSFIFWWYQKNWKANETEIESWNIENVWDFGNI